jgi:hypothetical protein
VFRILLLESGAAMPSRTDYIHVAASNVGTGILLRYMYVSSENEILLKKVHAGRGDLHVGCRCSYS